jgi:hypothetical protein
MTTQQDTSGSAFARLINDKALEQLGLTGPEFTRAWYDGRFRDDPRPAARALDNLMRTGRWEPDDL